MITKNNDARIHAIYARQSLDKKDSLSIQTQIDDCVKLIGSERYKVFSDKGKSGKNTDRAGLQSLFEEIKNGKIKSVYVYKLDRITRNINDFFSIYNFLKENKVNFVSSKDKFDVSTPMGEAMMGIVAVFAEMERANIIQRVTDNYYYRITEKGSWPGGPAPYGFKNGKNELKQATLIENGDEMDAVKEIFKLYSESPNISLAKVGKNLESMGYASRKRKSFDNVTIARILQNPIYIKADIALYYYFKTTGIESLDDESEWTGEFSAHVVGKNGSNVRGEGGLDTKKVYVTNVKGIIDSTTFISVQARLKENRQFGRSNASSLFGELAGKVKCAKCGYAVKIYNGKYLKCYNNVVLNGCDATFKTVSIADLQSSVADAIQEVLNGLSKALSDKSEESRSYLDQKSKLEQEIGKLTELYLLTDSKSDQIIANIKKKQRQIDKINLKIELSLVNKGFSKLANLNYLAMDTENRKNVVQKLINRIELDENSINIVWNI
ncbi:MAG: recombinase family protein [Clostridia bacterium]